MNEIPRIEERMPGLLVHFTDGSAATADTLAEALASRHLDQVMKVELYPSTATRLDGERGDQQIRGLALELLELPFPVMVVFPLELAQFLGRGLSEATVLRAP
jgi:hypothetical protein